MSDVDMIMNKNMLSVLLNKCFLENDTENIVNDKITATFDV